MATATAKRPPRVHCDAEGCTYSVEAGQEASLVPHQAMAHGGSARNDVDGQVALLEHPAPQASAGNPVSAGAALLEIPLELVDVGDNVRITLESMDELAASIVEHGVLQPVKATRLPDGRYRLLWGQRRVLAARKAGLATVPALVSDEEPDDRPIEQLVENLHRADLNPIDRAQAMRAVVDAGVSQADLARKLGIAPSTVANDLGLLEAPKKVQDLLEQGVITASHAKAIKGLAPKTQEELATHAGRDGWSAHRLEGEVQEQKRRADAEREHAQRDAKARKAKAEDLAASIADWPAKKKVPADAEIVIDAGYYGGRDDSALLEKLVREAGYAKVRVTQRYGELSGRSKGCDCTAWKATVASTYDYGSGRTTTYRAVIARACADPKHQKAKEQASEAARRDKVMVEERVRQHVNRTASGWALPDARAIAIDRILAEAALWSFLSYRIPEWAEGHGGTRKNPWAAIQALTDEDLAKELALAIAGDFRDHAGYHVDWPAVAEQLGLEATS